MPLAAAPPGVRVDVRGDRASDEEVHLLLPRHADVRMRVEVAVQGGRSALHRADHDHGGQGSGHGLRDTRGTDRHSRPTAGRPRRVAAHGGGYLTSGIADPTGGPPWTRFQTSPRRSPPPRGAWAGSAPWTGPWPRSRTPRSGPSRGSTTWGSPRSTRG